VAEAFVLEALRTARTATMVAGWGNVPGVTIKRFCAPGIDAVAQVAARILADDLELVAAGPERMNPNGGTIAMGQMGHAFGATGAILLGCLADELERRGAARGVLTNLLLPYALTQMTETQMTDGGVPSSASKRVEPDAVAPVLTALASQDCRLNGEYIVAGDGRSPPEPWPS
jgi:hypothetical protein